MPRFSLVLLVALLLAGCGSSGSSIVKITDILQVRPVLDDDPLASHVLDLEGNTIRVGDPIINDGRIWVVHLGKGATQNDLTIRLRDADAARWRNFARRNKGREAVLIIDGRVRANFTITPIADEDENTRIDIPNVVDTPEDAELLIKRLEAVRPAAPPPQTR
jgi:hypothetical protein